MLSGERLRHAARRRYGFTLIELVVILIVGGIVLALTVSVGNKLHRQLRAFGARIASDEQLRTAATILPLDLRPLSSAAGDIHAGEARDTSLEVNVTVANAIVCSAGADDLVLAPFTTSSGEVAGTSIQPGDALWLLVDTDSVEQWRVMSARDVGAAAACPPLASGDPRPPFALDRAVRVRVGAEHIAFAMQGAPVRVTRPVRYNLYRASDGQWYLGLRSWSVEAARFAAVQPVSGPYRPPASEPGSGTRLRYFDARGTELSAGLLDTRRITRIEWVFRPAAPTSAREARAAGDSLLLVVALRNAR